MSELPAGALVVVQEVPDDGQMLSVSTEIGPVVIANVGGSFYAFDGNCTHEGCPLSDGELDGFIVVCDCHGGEFDVRTGEPLGGPVEDPVGTYPVYCQDSRVLIGLRSSVNPGDSPG